jgi:uncharacterized protein
MSEAANVTVIRKLYEAMGKGDVEAAFALLEDDVEFVVPGPPHLGAAGTWRGHRGVQECLRRLRDGQENLSTDVRHFVAEAEQVVVLLHVRGKVLATGKEFESDIVHFFTLRHGRVVRLLDFFDTAALAEAYRP